jgi:SAM-dependent methyltransferase
MNATSVSTGELETTYEQRFRGNEARRTRVWQVLTNHFFQKWIKTTDAVLDIGAGYCEFINSIGAERKYAMDLNPSTGTKATVGVTVLNQNVGDTWQLTSNSVDVAFSSNFFEHLPDKNVLSHCLQEALRVIKPGGLLIAMGPNIRFCYHVYWDYYDHHLPLSDRSMQEALTLAGFRIEKVVPQFLPYTMQGGLPPAAILVRLYLALPIAWKIFGKQFLIIARKP